MYKPPPLSIGRREAETGGFAQGAGFPKPNAPR